MDVLIQKTSSIRLSRKFASPRLQCLPFDPPADREDRTWLLENMSNIPRYLFRVYSPKSSGTTDADWVKSVDAAHEWDGYDIDLFAEEDEQETAHMLNQHLRWWPKAHCTDNLTSWTSSLLFALQHAIYKHKSRKDKSAWHEIHLCVIDTTKFPHGVFIRDIDLMNAYEGLDEQLDNHREFREGCRSPPNADPYYFGEYLSQGALRIKNKCCIVSMDDLLNNGLISLRSDLDIETYTAVPQLANEVMRLRTLFYNRPMNYSLKQLEPTSDEEIKVAIAIGNLFGPPWQLPMMASFLSLRPREMNDGVILDMFRTQCSDAEREGCSPVTTKIAAHGMPEVSQFEAIMRSIYICQCREKLLNLTNLAKSYLTQATNFVRETSIEPRMKIKYADANAVVMSAKEENELMENICQIKGMARFLENQFEIRTDERS